MKSITLKIITARRGDYVPPQAGDTDISPVEENQILDSVERLVPESPDPDGEDVIELVTAALMDFDEDGRCTIRYEESELSGMEGTVTKITFLGDDRKILTIIREGTVNSTLVLEAGRFHTGQYETPVMPLEVTTMTYKLTNDVTEAGGVISANYSIRVGGVTTNRTKLTIEVIPH